MLTSTSKPASQQAAVLSFANKSYASNSPRLLPEASCQGTGRLCCVHERRSLPGLPPTAHSMQCASSRERPAQHQHKKKECRKFGSQTALDMQDFDPTRRSSSRSVSHHVCFSACFGQERKYMRMMIGRKDATTAGCAGRCAIYILAAAFTRPAQHTSPYLQGAPSSLRLSTGHRSFLRVQLQQTTIARLALIHLHQFRTVVQSSTRQRGQNSLGAVHSQSQRCPSF